MTRKDFELIADTVRTVYMRELSHGSYSLAMGALMVAREFAETLAATNPRFNRERFLKACGVEE